MRRSVLWRCANQQLIVQACRRIEAGILFYKTKKAPTQEPLWSFDMTGKGILDSHSLSAVREGGVCGGSRRFLPHLSEAEFPPAGS